MLTEYVNVFHGNGEITPEPEGIAKKWYFIKAGTGNTSPAATVPFGAMSAAPYSGGYPTGYGNHLVNTHSRPAKFSEGEKLIGFAHLQQSGTGTIGYYYNYALTVPFYPSSPYRREILDEKGAPGYYSCILEDIQCELTSSKRTAFHRYTFGKESGKVKIDFSNNGLSLPGSEKEGVFDLTVTKIGESAVTASAVIEGVRIYFAVRGDGSLEINKNEAVFSSFGKCCNIALSISLIDEENALSLLPEKVTGEIFDYAKKEADEKWEEALSHFLIETEDEKIKRIFYSNLYHSLVKPCDFTGDSFVYDKEKPFMTDFATLWDMYKTALPLILMSYRETGEKIAETLLSFCDALGEIPNSIGLSSKFMEHSTQARTLGAYVLMTAYHYKIKIDPHRMVKAIHRDIFADNKKDFTLLGKCQSNTFMLDMADCCALAADIAEKIGENEIASSLRPLAAQWETVFDSKTGLLKEDSEYYEGTLYNYSFRQMVDMEKRIEIAGGKENFVKLLDKFFGYGENDVTLPTNPFNGDEVRENMALGRFEGFNNESDTEAPFSYIYAGRHDRLCEIIRTGMKAMFTEGRGGIPGNNDSGALSSYYVLAALGLFPVAGQNLFLIGAPFVKRAEIRLSSGKTLKINVHNLSDDDIYVKSIAYNGKEVKNFMLPACDLMAGGVMDVRY